MNNASSTIEQDTAEAFTSFIVEHDRSPTEGEARAIFHSHFQRQPNLGYEDRLVNAMVHQHPLDELREERRFRVMMWLCGAPLATGN